jgi:hypothetical protein
MKRKRYATDQVVAAIKRHVVYSPDAPRPAVCAVLTLKWLRKIHYAALLEGRIAGCSRVGSMEPG